MKVQNVGISHKLFEYSRISADTVFLKLSASKFILECFHDLAHIDGVIV